MSDTINTLVARIVALENDLEKAFAAKRDEFAYHLEKRRVIFGSELAAQHRQLKVGLWAYLKRARLLVVLTAPFIYVLIVPFVLLDLFVSLYQAVCFPAYGIEKARRGDFIVFDRRHLGYLNGLEKLNCCYCSYANGLIAYVREIAARTEEYWCPIKHARRVEGTHRHYPGFAEYGDAEAFRNRPTVSKPVSEA